MEIARQSISKVGPRTRRRRVLLVNSALHPGGAEQVTANLALNLPKCGFDPAVCYLKSNGVVGQQLLRDGVAVMPLPGLRAGRRDYLTWAKLLKLIRALRIDVVHTHDLRGLVDAGICRLLMPRLRHVHTFHWGNYPRRAKRSALLERLFMRIPDALVAVGHRQAEGIRHLYGNRARRMQVIWNGTPEAAPSVAGEVESAIIGADCPIIASVSSLTPQKGIDHLLDAAFILQSKGLEFLLLIIGDGGLRSALEARARTLRLSSKVRFVGWVTEAPRRALPACDIFVQPSLWEGMSVVLLEAMSLGKAIVATDVGENPCVLENGDSGLLVPREDSSALATAIERFLSDRVLMRTCGASARHRYEQLFTADLMIDAYSRLYDELLAEYTRAAE